MSNIHNFLINPSAPKELEGFNVGHVNIINRTGSNDWGWTLARGETWGSSDDLENLFASAGTSLIRADYSGTNRLKGYEVDLRFPYESTGSGNPFISSVINGAGTFQYTLGLGNNGVPDSDFDLTTIERLNDGDISGNAAINFNNLANGDQPAFLIEFTEPIDINSIEMAVANKLAGKTFNFAYATGSAETYTIDTRQVTTTSANTLYKAPFNWKASPSRVLNDAPWTLDGLTWKNIQGVKKLLVYTEPLTGITSGPFVGQIKEFKINGIKYKNPNGITNLEHIKIRTTYNGAQNTDGWYMAYNTTNTNDGWSNDTTSTISDAIGPFNVAEFGDINDPSRQLDFPSLPPDQRFYRFRLWSLTDGDNPDAGDGLSRLIIYTTQGENIRTNFEFNDTVLETKAWNSSRYDGRQLSAKKINQSTIDDVGNNNKIPIIRNYTRNIYIGNSVIGMERGGNSDNDSLTCFPDFSYLQTNFYITINEDGSITKNQVDPQDPTNSKKKAFYRPFLYDFPIGSNCSIVMGDNAITNNLKQKYPIYFNGGQLQKILVIQNSTDAVTNHGPLALKHRLLDPLTDKINTVGNYGELYDTSSQNKGAFYFTLLSDPFNYASNNYDITSCFYLCNENIYNQWYTGSLVEPDKVTITTNGPTYKRGGAMLPEIYRYFNNFFEYKKKSDYKGDKRMFVTAIQSQTILDPRNFGNASLHPDSQSNFIIPNITHPGDPVYTFEPGGYISQSMADDIENVYPGGGIQINRLADLSTAEINSFNYYRINSSNHNWEWAFAEYDNNNLHQNYVPHHEWGVGSLNNTPPWVMNQDPDRRGYPDNFQPIDYGNRYGPGFMFSLVEDDVPSLLIPLKKSQELPNDKGDKPFIIIPENLHPYIKDNLTFYLSKAGIDIGGNATDKVEEDNSRRIGRQQPLSEAQLRELAARRREAYLSKTREGRRKLRREDRQERRSERREDREERRNERRQNRNERRENRQGNRNDRRENRQNRRENRRNRRRRR